MADTDLLALADRVEKLTGPDREVDADIWLAVTPGSTRKQWSYIHEFSGRECFVDETRAPGGRIVTVPCYTASIDAAMSLVPEGWFTRLAMEDRHFHSWKWELRGGYGVDANSRAAAPALALTCAALRARAISLPQGGDV